MARKSGSFGPALSDSGENGRAAEVLRWERRQSSGVRAHWGLPRSGACAGESRRCTAHHHRRGRGVGRHPAALDASGTGLTVSFVAVPSAHSVFQYDGTGHLTLVAGNGQAGFSGDGGPATRASLSEPTDVFVSSSALYIADTGNHRVRRVDLTTGSISTFAGNGTAAFSGDDGPAVDASLNRPSDVLVGAAGDLFVSDTGNHRVRRILNGTITTFAGSGVAGFGGDGGPATDASLSSPLGLALRQFSNGSAEVLIADSANHRVRAVDISTRTITTVVGTGVPGFSGDGGSPTAAQVAGPQGVDYYAADQQMFIADTGNNRVRIVAGDRISTFAGNGIAGWSGDGGAPNLASLSAPSALFAYWATSDTGNARIRSLRRVYQPPLYVDFVTVIGTLVDGTLAGYGGDGGPAPDARFFAPEGVAVDTDGTLFVADTLNHRVRRVDAGTGEVTTVAGTGLVGDSGDGASAASAQLASPTALALDGAGHLLIADTGNRRVRRLDLATGTIAAFAGSGVAAVTGSEGDGGPATDARLAGPAGLAVDAAGNAFIADPQVGRVRRVDAGTGAIATVLSGGWPTGVAVDGRGDLFVAERMNRYVLRVAAANGAITTVAGLARCNGSRSGGDGPAGNGPAGTETCLDNPTAVAVDGLGNLYVADGDRVRYLDRVSGLLSIVAGTGTHADGGDGGPATSAAVSGPRGLAIGPDHGALRRGYRQPPCPAGLDAPASERRPVCGDCVPGRRLHRERSEPRARRRFRRQRRRLGQHRIRARGLELHCLSGFEVRRNWPLGRPRGRLRPGLRGLRDLQRRRDDRRLLGHAGVPDSGDEGHRCGTALGRRSRGVQQYRYGRAARPVRPRLQLPAVTQRRRIVGTRVRALNLVEPRRAVAWRLLQ